MRFLLARQKPSSQSWNLLGRVNRMARALLVITIIPMVLVSIHPFAVRKIFLLALAILGLSSALCFADPVFMARQYDPARDHTRPARIAIASRANLKGHSLIWTALNNSPVAHYGLSVLRSQVPFGEAWGPMNSASQRGSDSALWEAPISRHADVDLTLAFVGPAGVIDAR
jgi:hypothetical protein